MSIKEKEEFRVKDKIIAGEPCFLIHPVDMGVTWTPQNLIYRSSMWNTAGEPISLGFRKFFNLNEKSHIIGEPDWNTPVNILEKCDGSCVIVSVYKGELIVRTRETFSCAEHLGGNGKQIIKWIEDRPLIKYYAERTNCSLIFECIDPKNRIILKPEKLNLVLLNAISHADYSYMSQNALDLVGAVLEVDRPKRFSYTLAQLRGLVKTQENFEGWCVYFNNDQNIIKLKTEWYLRANALKYDFRKVELIQDLVDSGANTREELLKYYAKDYDFEMLSVLDTDWLFEAKSKLDSDSQRGIDFAKEVQDLDKKDRAHAVHTNLTKNLWEYAFSFLTHGKITNKLKLKKLKNLCKNQLQISE